MNLKQLQERLTAIKEEMAKIAGLKNISDEQYADLDALTAEAEKVEKRIKAFQYSEPGPEGEDKPESDAAPESDGVRAELAELQAKFAKLEGEPGKPEGGIKTGAPTVREFANLDKFDNLDAGETAVLVGILQAAGKPVSEDALKALAIKSTEAEDKDKHYVRTRRAMKAAGMPIKANELNQSTLASYGDEWVGVAYSNELWRKIVLATSIVGRIPAVEIPQGSESIVIPTQSTSPTFYKVAQASAQASDTLGAVTNTITSSKMGTANQTLSVGKIGAAVIYTSELEEDSLINWAAELKADLEREGAEVLESLVIDGDTDASASTNINDIAGTPAATDYFLTLNGFRKLALVTNTANKRAAGGLDVEDFLETAKLLGLGGRNAVEKGKTAFIIDLHTHWKALTLSEVKTRDSYASPTIEGGSLTSLWGYDVLPSANMHRANQDATYGLKANSAGKIDLDTAANNTTGSILAVRFDQWKLGFKRRMRFEVMRVPRADSTELTVTMRVGLQYRDTDASAISYGVAV